MKTMVPVLSIFVVAPVCSYGAPIPTEKSKDALYYPVSIGARWVYSTGDKETVETVTGVEDSEGVFRVKVSRERNDKTILDHVVAVSEKGLAIVETPTGKLAEPVWLLKLPPKNGDKWEVVLPSQTLGKIVGSAAVEGTEKIEVPAGTFDAVKVRMEIPHVDGRDGITKRAIWYAPNVGVVKSVEGETVRVLKSFAKKK